MKYLIFKGMVVATAYMKFTGLGEFIGDLAIRLTINE